MTTASILRSRGFNNIIDIEGGFNNIKEKANIKMTSEELVSA
jgi:hypothetical protein